MVALVLSLRKKKEAGDVSRLWCVFSKKKWFSRLLFLGGFFFGFGFGDVFFVDGFDDGFAVFHFY
jgi:uncharacterized membrane protein YedE/YeeE